MSENRFSWETEKLQHSDDEVIMVIDNANKEWKGHILNIVDLLNEQEAIIITLKRRLEKINGGYGHLTHRNGLTANEWLIESQEKELQKKNEQISDLKEENKRLRQTIQEVCELLAEAIHLFSDATIYLIPAIEKAIKLLKGGIDE